MNKQEYIANKIREIKSKGVRKNTHAPVSSSNPRRSVPEKQRIATALSEAKRRGYKV